MVGVTVLGRTDDGNERVDAAVGFSGVPGSDSVTGVRIGSIVLTGGLVRSRPPPEAVSVFLDNAMAFTASRRASIVVASSETALVVVELGGEGGPEDDDMLDNIIERGSTACSELWMLDEVTSKIVRAKMRAKIK